MSANAQTTQSTEAERVCRRIGLIHYPDTQPGIRRERRGRGFSYLSPNGNRIKDIEQRENLAALAVPPAYSDVWISPHQNGHLLATGRDTADRKQYRYHPDWTEYHHSLKFDRLVELGEGLPKLRRWIARNMRDGVGSQDAAIATALCLMERHSLRVGHPSYSRQNGSFATTTLQRRHFIEQPGHAMLSFTAKGGAAVEKRLRGATLIDRLRLAPATANAPLIGWRDPRGNWRRLSAQVIAERMCDLVGADVTPKLLRTWNGSRAAFVAARAETKPSLTSIAEAASRVLHNTPAIARLSYIHPAIIGAVRDQRELPSDAISVPSGLKVGEAGLLALIRSS